jgi:hypothetical protein
VRAVVGRKIERARRVGAREAFGGLVAELFGDGERRRRWRLGARPEREGKREGEGSDEAMAVPHRGILRHGLVRARTAHLSSQECRRRVRTAHRPSGACGPLIHGLM